MRNFILALAFCCIMFCAGSLQVSAADLSTDVSIPVNSTISPLMDYISQANASLYIDSNGVATVKSSVYGYQGITTRVEIRANLQQYTGGQWVAIKTFTVESDSHRASLSHTFNVPKGFYYRVQATIKAYSSSSVETRTVTSSNTVY